MAALFWVAMGCGSGAGDAPVQLESPPGERTELEPYSGRWLPVKEQADGTWARCDRGPTVEFRQDSQAGWELVTTGEDEIRVSRVGPVTSGTGSVTIRLVEEGPVTGGLTARLNAPWLPPYPSTTMK